MTKTSDVKLYDVIANGEKKYGLPEEEVVRLYSSSVLDRRSPCRVYGTEEWKSIDECLPLLKYSSPSLAAVHPPPPAPHIAPGVRSSIGTDERGLPAKTTALRAGWVCFGLGLCVAWFFPPAYFLFSVAIVTAIIAMCTRQVGKGLILLLSSFLGAGLCLFVSFILAVGFFAVVAGHAVAKVHDDVERAKAAQPLVVPRLPPQSPAPLRLPTIQPLPKVQTSVRVQPPTAPPQKPVASLTQREMFEEIARIEKQQRELRAQRSDLPPAARERLDQLRAAYQ